MDFYLGGIILWPMNWEPEGFAVCDGRLLKIASYQALYSLIGKQFGGDGITTFALPDLRGRVPVGFNQGTTVIGQTGGSATNTLSTDNLPSHTHTGTLSNINMTCNASASFTMPATSAVGNISKPDNNSCLAQSTKVGATSVNIYNNSTNGINDVQLPGGTVALTGNIEGTADVVNSNTGNGTQINNMQPYVALNYIICIEGIYPPRI